MSATQIIILGFLALILLGALLLYLPSASVGYGSAPFVTCLFTAVSATCVTGLSLVDTATYWTAGGQAVILVMIQIGGLGFMMFAVTMSMILRKKISPRVRLIVAQSLNLSSLSGVIRLARRIVAGTLAFEAVGAVFLAIRFVPMFGAEGVWKAVFTSVSAFCNAGFDLMGDSSGRFSSLTAFSDDPLVCFTVMALIIIGGIGFIVWDDIYEHITARRRLSVYSGFVLLVTGILIAAGFAVTALCEWNNPALGGSADEKLLAALFHSVSLRTAGFCVSDVTAFSDLTMLVSCGLMFIGGASGSTAGGVKVATFGIVVLALVNIARGQTKVNIRRRQIAGGNVLRALAVAGMQLAIALGGVAVLLICGAPLTASLVESFSATGTVGISLSLTPSLPTAAHFALMAQMFFGRTGILTFTYAVMMKLASESTTIEYAETPMLIG